MWINNFELVMKVDADANANAQTAFYTQLTSSYTSDYNQFESVTSNLLNQIQPIVNAGPSQYGFAPAEDATLRSTATDADAAATQNAKVAANQQITAANGGAAVTPTGGAEELTEQADQAGAQKLSSDQLGITAAGYAQGTQNYSTALGQEDDVMGLMNPNSFAGAATGGGNAATGAVNAAETADNSWETMVGAGLGAAGAVFGGAFKAPSAPNSGEGTPFSGM
jgi:hypothetical protein